MADIEALKQALRQGAQGKANLASLDEQYARGVALRDGASAKMDQYGQVSPLAVIADVMNASQGRRDLRELGPERDAARQSVANNANAMGLHTAGVNAEKVVQDQSNFDTTAANRITAANSLANAKIAADKKKVEDAKKTALTLSTGKIKAENDRLKNLLARVAAGSVEPSAVEGMLS
jgi:hypothetical protein